MQRFKNILGSRQTIVSVDFGTDAVRVIALHQDADGAWRHQAAFTLPAIALDRPIADHLALGFREKIREHGLDGARCRVTLSANNFHSDLAQLPVMNDAELAAAARFEALDRFGVDEADVVIQHVTLVQQSTDHRDVMLLAVPQKIVRNAAQAVSAASLSVESVEHAAFTALRGISRWQNQTQIGLVAALHLESTVATLMLMRDGVLAHARCIKGDWSAALAQAPTPYGAHDADSIPLDPIDSSKSWRWSCLAEETLRCLRHACGETMWPTHLIVSGPAAGDDSMLKALQGVCGLPACCADSDRWMQGSNNLQGEAWASALGAASLDIKYMEVRRAA